MSEASEGLSQKEQSPIKNLEAEEVFKPFGEIKELPPMNPVLLEHNKFRKTQRAAEFPFTFKAARGIIDLNPDINSDEYRGEERIYHFKNKGENETPLGRVNLVKSIENNQITIEQAPLSLGLFFHVSNDEQLQELKKYAIEFTLEKRKYYMSLVQQWQSWQTNEFFTRRGLPIPPHRKEGQGFYNAEIFPEEILTELNRPENEFYIPPTVLLPYDASKLNQIEAKIVEKKIYPEKEELESNIT